MAQDAYKDIFEGQIWHQRWEIEPGVFTPGGNSVADIMDWSGVPKSLVGHRVLDIGAWNGCCSFECERRGAAEVVALGPENPEKYGFNKLKSHLGSKVQYRLGTIYDLQPRRIGTFDTVLCFGVLYHLRHLLLGLDMMRRIAKRDLHIESHRSDLLPGGRHDRFAGPPPAGVSQDVSDDDEALLPFYRGDELNSDPSNWFSPNRRALRDMLLSAGFEPLSLTLHPNGRVAAHAQVIPGPPEWVTSGAIEGAYFDVVMKPVLGDKDVY